MVRPTTIPLLILAAITLTPSGVRAGAITYNIVNYPDSGRGSMVSGTITTNGTTGTNLPGADITSWDITVTAPFITVPYTPSNTLVDPTTSFDATSTDITTGRASATIYIHDKLNPSGLISWTFINNAVYYNAGGQGHVLWGGILPSLDSPVATVPEPSTSVLAGIGAGTVVACGLVRHRRAKRRQPDAGHPQPTE
jgi:hypothetical protein